MDLFNLQFAEQRPPSLRLTSINITVRLQMSSTTSLGAQRCLRKNALSIGRRQQHGLLGTPPTRRPL